MGTKGNIEWSDYLDHKISKKWSGGELVIAVLSERGAYSALIEWLDTASGLIETPKMREQGRLKKIKV